MLKDFTPLLNMANLDSLKSSNHHIPPRLMRVKYLAIMPDLTTVAKPHTLAPLGVCQRLDPLGESRCGGLCSMEKGETLANYARRLGRKSTSIPKLVAAAFLMGSLLILHVVLDAIADTYKSKTEEVITNLVATETQNSYMRAVLWRVTPIALKYPTATVFAVFLSLIVVFVFVSWAELRFGRHGESRPPLSDPDVSRSEPPNESSTASPQKRETQLRSEVRFASVEQRSLVLREGIFHLASVSEATHESFVMPFANEAGYWWSPKVQRANAVTARVLLMAAPTKKEQREHKRAQEIYRVRHAAWLGTMENFVSIEVEGLRYLILAVRDLKARNDWCAVESVEKKWTTGGQRLRLWKLADSRIKALHVEPIVDGVNVAVGYELSTELSPILDESLDPADQKTP